MTSDKTVEKERYDQRAQKMLQQQSPAAGPIGSLSLPAYLRQPYTDYEKLLQQNLAAGNKYALEIGAGTGLHTSTLLQSAARVCATDISEHSLEFIRKRFDNPKNLDTRVADIEALPFADGSFDLVANAGSLSYGDNQTVMLEIYRVLKPGGCFICVDSLNHNPVYRANRWLHYKRGNRSLSTLKRMPDLSLIEQYRRTFGQVEVRFFGSISWATPLLRRLISDTRLASLSDHIDRITGVRRAAFKFVMLARKVEAGETGS